MSSIKDTDSVKEHEVTANKGENVSAYVKKTPEERQAALAAALLVDPGTQSYSLRAFYLYLCVFTASMCSTDSGFDGTVMSGINSMSQFLDYFGLTDASPSTGIIFGIFTIGSLCGCIPASYVPDKFGRRAGMLLGNLLLIVGAIITATSKNMSTLIGGRFLTGFGATCGASSAKSYVGEISPPQNRGRYLGLTNCFFYVGSVTATGMMVATQKWPNNWSWRLPFFIQMVPAAINVFFILWCPESPRWLYSVGKTEQARKVLALLHSKTGDVNSPLIQLEIEEIEEYVQVNGPDKRWWDFRPLFRTRPDRYRTGMIILIGTFGQLSGNGLITYFLPVLLRTAGIQSQTKRLTLTFVNAITSFIGAITGASIVDRFGRRRLLLTATALITGCLVIVAALLSDTTNPTRANAGISFIYIFMIIYSFGWTPMQSLYVAEVLPYAARAKGVALQFVSSQAVGCINTFAMPVALGKIGWKVYLIFIFWDAFEWIIIYLFLVETKGLTLEEIEDVFQNENPRKFSTQHAKHAKEVKKALAAENTIAS